MRRLVLLLTFALIAPSVRAEEKPQIKKIADVTAGLQKLDGFMPLYWDAATGRLYFEISRFDTEILYQVSLAAGVGSNPIGLDRGQLGGTHVVAFQRIGPRVLMVEPNYDYRAVSDSALERRAVEDSFARSVLWGFDIDAVEGDRVLVDATAFFLRDAHGVADRLRDANQGSYGLDSSRSAFYLPRTKSFPKNTEVETILTFTANGPTGRLVGQTVPTAAALSVREHASFVELPDSNYRPRRSDPRAGYISLSYYDYAKPIDEAIEQRIIIRHRLQKKDPSAAVSEPVEPIVYYVDPATPEPIRSALVEGASWWNEAFEAAGFKNGFQVRLLPADADPMDIRYNVINWVQRSTRGWSYGASVTDPRTGEIIKGDVTLDSLRIRQDYLIGSGLVPPFAGGEFGDAPDADYLLPADASSEAKTMALARIRQLAAHEVGHTLGLEHNFAASTYGRASVMDYPAPLVEIKNGKLDLSNAYATGIGAYDKFAITYGYAQFPPGADENAELDRIVESGERSGMLHISDEDARPAGAAHPLASLWDNGPDPVAMLRHEMEVRRIGLAQFGLGSIPTGAPLSTLEAKLLPLYLHHRYQLAAAVKSVGGLYYTYAVKSAAGPSPARVREIVPAATQRDALRAVLETISLDELAIPKRILALIPPMAPGYSEGTRELFEKRADPAFDPVGAATIAADLAVSSLLEPHRAARLVEFHGENPANPGFAEVVDALVAATWRTPPQADGYRAVISREVQSLVVGRLMDLASDADASPQVRAVATDALRSLSARLGAPAARASRLDAAHRRATRDDIERFLARPDAPRKRTTPLSPPPGDPIGS